ncbi:MAG: M56 family metallopeptidase [Eubacteriales bacterium]|nr:M56 family metallopeptidase [Eubacteriales bacterium]
MTGWTLEGMLIEILNMSLTASVVIVAVLAARLLLRRAPRIFSYALWAVVLFRLLCPVSFSAPLSLLGALQNETDGRGHMEYISQDIGYERTPTVELPVGVADGPVNASLPAGNDATSVNPLQIWLYAGARIWLLGVAGMLAYSVVSMCRLKKRLTAAVRERDCIYRLPDGGTPFVYGVLRPRIYLPSGLSEEEERYILLHEQTHIRRGDPLLRLLAWAALCLHWFDPLVWLAFSYSGRDMEMSCDEAVIRVMGGGVKKAYAESLLACASGRRRIRGMPLAFGEGDTGSRIRNVLRYRTPGRLMLCAAAAVCIALALWLAANPASSSGSPALAGETGAETDASQENTGAEAEGAEGTGESADTAGGGQAETGEGVDAAETDAVFGQRELLEVTAEALADGALPDGSYLVRVQSFSESRRGFDRYLADGWDAEHEPEEYPFLALADTCVFLTNRSMDRADYGEISYEEFAELMRQGENQYYRQVACELQGGRIVRAELDSEWYAFGIFYEPLYPEDSVGDMAEAADMTVEEFLAEFYTLDSEETRDVSDRAEEETVEVYVGNAGDGDSGVALVRSADGMILDTEWAHTARAGWNNLYVGELDGTAYLLSVTVEDRETYGAYGYQVWRPDGAGEPRQIAGSSLSWNSDVLYNENVFRQWADGLAVYLENSHLILGSQEGVIRTEKVNEADRWSYESLRGYGAYCRKN